MLAKLQNCWEMIFIDPDGIFENTVVTVNVHFCSHNVSFSSRRTPLEIPPWGHSISRRPYEPLEAGVDWGLYHKEEFRPSRLRGLAFGSRRRGRVLLDRANGNLGVALGPKWIKVFGYGENFWKLNLHTYYFFSDTFRSLQEEMRVMWSMRGTLRRSSSFSWLISRGRTTTFSSGSLLRKKIEM